MFLQLAARTGFTQIVVSDFSHEKLSIAKQLGADLALCPLDDADKQTLDALSHRGFDIIIDCTGSIKSMQTTVDRLAFGRQILLFGLCSAELSMEIKPFRLTQKDASLMTSFALTKHSSGRRSPCWKTAKSTRSCSSTVCALVRSWSKALWTSLRDEARANHHRHLSLSSTVALPGCANTEPHGADLC